MKLILVVRCASIVMALNWATVLRAVTAAKPTASAAADLIMPQERASDFDALHPVAISNAGTISRPCSTSSGAGAGLGR